MAAVRVSLSWFGTRKTLTAEQRSQAADTFGAEGAFLSAGKKLLDTKHEAYKGVTTVNRSRACGENMGGLCPSGRTLRAMARTAVVKPSDSPAVHASTLVGLSVPRTGGAKCDAYSAGIKPSAGNVWY
jgi:hypothetical protein